MRTEPIEPSWASPDEPWPGLTPMQTVVACGICMGLTRSEIAMDLGMSVKTYDSHRLRIMDRMSVSNEILLLRKAIQVGLVEIEVLK